MGDTTSAKTEILQAEDTPVVEIGPVFDLSRPGERDALKRWLFEGHVSVCRKGGIDCKSCDEAAKLGIGRPA